MFDIGFPELLLLGIVMLLVMGPERLPEATRTVIRAIERVRSQAMRIRMDLEREVGADEIRREIHNNEIMRELRETRADLDQTASALNNKILPTAPRPEAEDDANQNYRR